MITDLLDSDKIPILVTSIRIKKWKDTLRI